MSLTQRQINEIEFHKNYYKNIDFNIDFNSILLDNHKERKPWNCYWKVYESVFNFYKDNGKKSKILDFGCGIGKSAIMYRKLGFKNIFAFDISPEAISHAKKIEKKHFKNSLIKFSVQSSENLEYVDNFFDYIIGFDILHHADIEKSIKEISRILKRDGTVIFLEHLYSKIFDAIRDSKLVRIFFPKTESYNKYRTKYEAKISKAQLELIKSNFKKTKIYYFGIFSRFVNIKFLSKYQRILEKIDYFLLSSFPFLKILAEKGIIILKFPINE